MHASDIKHGNSALETKLQTLYTLNRAKSIDLSFRPAYLDLLQKFGNPHLNLPPVIHVAGTNGKGSTTAMLKAILEAQAYRVHAYTSPHLCAFNERIYLAGQTIGDQSLEALIDEALALNGGADATFFEITTALAFAAFARTPADILLLEVGLGGRLDCTNVIKQPAACVITALGYDHMEFLGTTLSEIAFEKAGIFKKGAPCVIAPQSREVLQSGAMDVIRRQALEKNADLYRGGTEWRIEPCADGMRWSLNDERTVFPLPNLTGPYQIDNAGTAITAVKILAKRFPVSNQSIAQGLKNIHWPARLQNLTQHCRRLDLKNCEIWLDGGHNENAAQGLAAQADLWARRDARPLHLIMGMLDSKDAGGFITPLARYLDGAYAVEIPDEPKAMAPETLKNAISLALPGKPVQTAADWQEAAAAVAAKNPGARILIAGSLYLAGQVLKTLP